MTIKELKKELEQRIVYCDRMQKSTAENYKYAAAEYWRVSQLTYELVLKLLDGK